MSRSPSNRCQHVDRLLAIGGLLPMLEADQAVPEHHFLLHHPELGFSYAHLLGRAGHRAADELYEELVTMAPVPTGMLKAEGLEDLISARLSSRTLVRSRDPGSLTNRSPERGLRSLGRRPSSLQTPRAQRLNAGSQRSPRPASHAGWGALPCHCRETGRARSGDPGVTHGFFQWHHGTYETVTRQRNRRGTGRRPTAGPMRAAGNQRRTGGRDPPDRQSTRQPTPSCPRQLGAVGRSMTMMHRDHPTAGRFDPRRLHA